jgi:hypothetical protein
MLGQIARRIAASGLASAQFVDDLLQLRDDLVPLLARF